MNEDLKDQFIIGTISVDYKREKGKKEDENNISKFIPIYKIKISIT